MTTDNFGTHLTIDIENCDAKKLVDNKFIYGLLNDLPVKLDMKAISPPFVIEYKDKWASTAGLTGFVIIATSHISLHTFPDNRYTFFDIFSCRHFKVKSIINYIKQQFNSDKITINTIERGKNFIQK